MAEMGILPSTWLPLGSQACLDGDGVSEKQTTHMTDSAWRAGSLVVGAGGSPPRWIASATGR